MASDSDDADNDFFDKLVEDDDDADNRLPPADVGDLSALSLADANDDDDAAEPVPPIPVAELEGKPAAGPPEAEDGEVEPAVEPTNAVVGEAVDGEVEPAPEPTKAEDGEVDGEVSPAAEPTKAEDGEVDGEVRPAAESPNADGEAAAPPPEVKVAAAEAPRAEGDSPGSAKAVHTAVKQVQWSAFASNSGEADPFAEFLQGDGGGGGAQDAIFGGDLIGNQGVLGSVVGTSGDEQPVDHSFTGEVDNIDNSQFNWGASAVESVDQHTSIQSEWAGGAVDSTTSTDPKYLESLYPGWKFDEAKQEWYQVDTHGAQGSADNGGAATVAGGDNVQQQQQFSVSYPHNTLQAGLETIAEEGSIAAASWGQDESSAAAVEYPSNMQFYAEYPGWYFDTNTQQWYALESYQHGVVQTATSASVSDGFAGTGHNVAQQSVSYASDYSQQRQWQQGLSSSSLHVVNQIDQQDSAKPLEPSTIHQTDINTFVPPISQYTISEDQQSSYHGFGSSNSHQSTYEAFQAPTIHQNQIGQQANVKPLESSSNNRTDINTFVPFASQYTTSEDHQASHIGFESSNSHQSTHEGFQPLSHQSTSTSHHSGYKHSEPSTVHQAGFQGFKPLTNNQSYNVLSHHSNLNGAAKPQDFVPTASMYQPQTHANSNAHMNLPNNYLSSENSMNFSQQQFIASTNASSQQFGYFPHEQRSSAGRPPHVLVTFGFGGKLVVVRETSSMSTNLDRGNQGNSCGTVSVLNISEVVADKIDCPSIPDGSALSYFHALCHQPIPGPLVGGNAAVKDVNKWLDVITGSYESSIRDFQGGDVQKLLVSLLKILCQHYGKLRSPFGLDPSEEGIDGPEMAVTKLFSSCKSSGSHLGEYGAIAHCMKNIPSENQIQTTAKEVQNLLVSGRRKEALQYAQEGQLWGPAIILALQLGDKFYVDTVKKMAQRHFMSGSPLRTLCLLIAEQPADVFNVESPVDPSYGTSHRSQQSVEATPNGMLDNWQENLAIIAANRTKGDDLVITHLGDCLWKEKTEIAAAHSCYLVAELNIESYSESARMCLIGADHWRCPRTFISPQAIQRTEVYEYAKVLGNSQYILFPFQPYKLIYAYMLAEVGKVSDSVRYCQACLKALKSSGRAPELEAFKQLVSSLEERIRIHQQGGYGTNLAPAKIVGKIFTTLDKSLSRMMGTQPAPSLPPLPHGSSTDRSFYSAPVATNVLNSQSVMATSSSLMSSASEQSMSEVVGNSSPGRNVTHNRSASEPDFARSPKQGAGSDNAQSTSGSGSSRLGWFLQKTMGLVSKPHNQAKLGEQNKFYYDAKLQRWVEEGADIPAAEPPLPPPPTKTSFQNAMPDYSSNGPRSGGYTPNGFAEPKPPIPELSSGMPPMPPSQNQFSARGRMGVRSRYVDTFNKGGANAFGSAAATSYSKPTVPSINPLAGATFFVPTPAAVAPEQMVDSTVNARQGEPSSSPAMEASLSAPAMPVQSSIQRHPSMDNIMTPSGSMKGNSLSRSRPASWSGTYPDQLSSGAVSRSPDGQVTQSPPIPGKRHSHSRSSSNSSAQLNNWGEDLQEVEL